LAVSDQSGPGSLEQESQGSNGGKNREEKGSK